MRTNIVIDPDLLDAAMRVGPFKTKKEAVEAGLKLLARQAAYREILRWEGKLHWDDSPAAPPQTGAAEQRSAAVTAHEPAVERARRGRR